MSSISRSVCVNSENETFDSRYVDGDDDSISSSDELSSDELGIIMLGFLPFLVVGVDNAIVIHV
jgi:hypothetical protein